MYLQKEKKTKKIESFLPKLKDQIIEITLMNGLTFKAKLLGYSRFEILIELLSSKEELIVFKHSILSIKRCDTIKSDKNEK